MINDLRELRAYCGNKEVFVDRRIRVRGRSNMTLLPDFFLVEVYNADPMDIATLETAKKLKFQTKNMAILCSGEVEDIYSRMDGSNRVHEISISDGQSFWQTRLSKSVGPGVSFSSTIKQILSNATMGSYLAKDDRFVRSQAFTGRLADAIADITKGIHARAFISNNVLHVVEKGRSEIIVKVEESDVITEPNMALGVCIVQTQVKGWPVGTIVEFRGKQYRLASQEINADNFQGTWKTELTLVDEKYLDADGMDGG